MKAKSVKAWCVVENDNDIFVYDCQIPIYWHKKMAEEYAKVQNQIGNPCKVIPCTITLGKVRK